MNIKLYITTFLLLGLISFFKGQSNPHLLPDHDFVVYDSANIRFYNDSSNYDTFFGKLDDVIFNGNGKVRVMQIGGSHIQADIWSDQIRKNFQKVSNSSKCLKSKNVTKSVKSVKK